tara:strand:- start:560 stop:1234 length:675 start_codon:yes stop_codon:yes gene_type:complete
MNLDLPELDIVADIEEIMDDEQITEEQYQEEMAKQEEEKQPFVKKQPIQKKKKELSEKQIAHLDKIRGMALEKRQVKATAKKEALQKVVETHQPKYYKAKPKKSQAEKQLEKEAIAKYKKTTIPIDETIKEHVADKTPEDFVPEHKEIVKQKKQNVELETQHNFNHFMGNMEKYLKLRTDYEKAKQPVVKETVPHIEKPKPVKEPVPQMLTPQEPQNMYSSFFG